MGREESVVSPFGVVGLTVPKYDIEFRGLTESGIVNSMNPLNSLSYLPDSYPATLNRETTTRWLAAESRSSTGKVCLRRHIFAGEGRSCDRDRGLSRQAAPMVTRSFVSVSSLKIGSGGSLRIDYFAGMPSYTEVTASLRPSGPAPLFTTTTEGMVGD